MNMPRLSRFLAILCTSLVLAFGVADAAPKKEVNEYPKATRKEPKPQVTESNQKKLGAAYEAIDKGDTAKAEESLNAVLNNSKSSAYERAAALVGLANVAWEGDRPEEAIKYNEQAVALDALDNRAHFNALYQIAQMNLQEQHYDASLKAVDQWLALTQSEKPDAYALKGNAQYRNEQFADAAVTMRKAISLSDKPSDSWYQILLASYNDAENYDEAAKVAQELLAKDPKNKKVTMMLASIYLQGKQDAKALETFENAYAQGLLTEEKEIKQLYQSYSYLEKPAKAIEVINAELAKGTLKPSLDTYKGLGDAYALSSESLPENDPKRKEFSTQAAEAYGKAAALQPANGELDMLRGHLLLDLERFKESQESMHAALK